MTYADAPKPADAVRTFGDLLDRAKQSWGWFVGLGVLTALAGFFALVYVGVATVATVIYIAAAMIVSGLFEIIVGFQAKTWGRLAWMIAVGVLYVAAGISMVQNPLLASSVMTLMLGAMFAVSGVARLFMAFDVPAGNVRTMMIVSGLVTLALGVMVLVMWPGSSLVLLGSLLGVDLLTTGMGWLSFGLALKNRV